MWHPFCVDVVDDVTYYYIMYYEYIKIECVFVSIGIYKIHMTRIFLLRKARRKKGQKCI